MTTESSMEQSGVLASGELAARLAAGAECRLVDVREYAEYAGGRIKGSTLLPLGSLEQGAAGLERGGALVLVCRSGRRSREAARRLAAMGFGRVQVLDGGIEAWKRAGLPLEREAGAPWAIERQVRLVAGSMVLGGALLAWWVHPGFVWVCAGVGAGLVFAAVTDSCMMGNLLGCLPWNRAGGVTQCGPCGEMGR